MELKILESKDTLNEALEAAGAYFRLNMKAIKSTLSMFEQYELRPIARVFIPEVWKYRIIAKNGKFHFGKIG